MSASVVEGLERSGAIERIEMTPPPVALPPDPDAEPPTLNVEGRPQGRSRRSAGSGSTRFGVALLDGVTGGGKTEVFFEAVADTLRAGRQALGTAAGDRADLDFCVAVPQRLRPAPSRMAFRI